MRASFKSGKFIEHLNANSVIVKPTGKTKSEQTQPIQLWTGNKLLDDDIAACAKKVEVVLKLLRFREMTKSGYPTEIYFYANQNENRAGIHCTSIAGQTFVYGSVAGVDVKAVERLRNDIFGKL